MSSAMILMFVSIYDNFLFQVSVYEFRGRIRAPSCSHGRCAYCEMSNMLVKLLQNWCCSFIYARTRIAVGSVETLLNVF